MAALRPELPTLPVRMRHLRVHRGYPVPFFVHWPSPDEPDFRVIDPPAMRACVKEDRCWVCGGKLGRWRAYVSGPMCGVNRTSAEPPSHVDCAVWSARACPFLTRPHARRRDVTDLPTADMPGVAIMRNPGVAMIWVVTGETRRRSDGRGGVLFVMPDPERVLWFCEGRTATRAEVMASVDSGLPTLRDMADKHGEGAALDAAVDRFMPVVPEADDNERGAV